MARRNRRPSALEPAGYRVRTATNGRAGLAAATAEDVDLILVDLVLPDISGLDVIDALRREERTRHVPIVIITANEISADDRLRLVGSVEAILAKGQTSTAGLVAELDRVLGQAP